MFRKAMTTLLMSSFALFWPVGTTMAENAALPTSAPARPVVYQPPLRGAPDRRVGGGTRGGAIDLSVLAPKQSAWSNQDQPRLFWFISTLPAQGKLAFSLAKASSAAHVYKTSIPMPDRPGIQSFQLKAYRLEPGVEYVWSISLTFGQDDDRPDQVTRAGIIFNAVTQEENERWEKLKEDDLTLLQAKSGYWYDAVATLIESSSNAYPHREWLKDLLNQVGLVYIAN